MNGNDSAFPATRIETDLDYDTDREQHYPRTYTHSEGGGLTKREYFAGRAMQGMLAALTPAEKDLGVSMVAHASVMHADALLKALHESNEEIKF